jgi:class 3 adenylate cyclase
MLCVASNIAILPCQQIYPSDSFKDAYDTNLPETFAAAIAATFALVVLVFFVYDIMVKRRNDKLVNNAAQSNALVSSLFPGMFRDRVLDERAEKTKKQKEEHQGAGPTLLNRQTNLLNTFLNHGGNRQEDLQVDSGNAPLADLFPETTVMFADLVGFTAWSSAREPGQVFTLLETIYGSFDKIAKRRKVFKVETIGDCYVAVAGLPDPLPDHAVAMAHFGQDCMTALPRLTKKLEVTLGPGTRDLLIRVGIHSGPVIAGVLRGERARFQLFGDTMNTASRMESTSESGRIQLSEDTARLLLKDGKEKWIEKREDCVVVKGKGAMQTYWLTLKSRYASSEMTSNTDSATVISEVKESEDSQIFDARTTRLVDWNIGMLLELLKHVIIQRTSNNAKAIGTVENHESKNLDKTVEMPLEEVAELIDLPDIDSKGVHSQKDTSDVVFSPIVVGQLRDYITTVASMYRFNAFHGFEHASHVAMSMAKLMSRIAAPTHCAGRDGNDQNCKHGLSVDLGNHTFGIAGDALIEFACVFAALIHDVGHTGVPNSQLQEEDPELSAKYGNRSVAEQNSFDVAWDLLMEGPYSDLRATLWEDVSELKRFRQIVINCIMATDLFDSDLKALRQDRWDKAFESSNDDTSGDTANRKATIVIEHLIQASDVSHAIQGWHVYCKWNERLFEEMIVAYNNGRAVKNPAESWYQGELNFFDFYVIPLAKKLRDFGVFGLSSDEFLNYAISNRDEWEAKGHGVVSQMLKKVEQNPESW